MKRWLDVALGIVTSVGGFLEIGSITTAAQAGAEYKYQLAWAIVLGTVCIALLIEMSGRFAAVSHHTVPDAIRERFADTAVTIPMTVAGVRSLNLATAVGIVLYEALRQRHGW